MPNCSVCAARDAPADREGRMNESLSTEELVALVRRVFRPGPEDRRMAVLIDLPGGRVADNDAWRARRALGADWAARLAAARDALGLDVSLVVYPNVGTNNGDLPARVWVTGGGTLPGDDLDPADAVPLERVLAEHTILMAPTEFSATAPLKLLARRFPFRAATMAGFSPAMVPALRLDYGEVRRRVRIMKALLDDAARAELAFEVAGMESCELVLDLRHRTAHASDGILDTPGTAGNLPSGEAYIVPYEGEHVGDPSASAGRLPVQFDDEIVVYTIERNRAVRADGDGSAARAEAAAIAREPAYANLAELGLGVLGDLGVEPSGEILLDEKLGLHIAFGRSDHFGGQVGAAQFSSPAAVVHIDRVYIPRLQPRVRVRSVDLVQSDGSRLPLMRDGRYLPERLA
jgi:hypothetical protein